MEVGALNEWGGGITGSSESESVCSGPSAMIELMNPGSGLRLQPGSAGEVSESGTNFKAHLGLVLWKSYNYAHYTCLG